MPMGIVSDKDFQSELSNVSTTKENSEKKPIPSNNPPTISGEVIDVNRGRGLGNNQVPNSLRNIIGEESSINGRQSAVELASQFGLSPSSVSAYDVGATSTSTYDKRPNSPIINQARERIAKRARGKLMRALNKITDEKLDAANAKDLAGIAKDMSAVVRTMEPEKESDSKEKNNGPTFVFYAPQYRKEEYFETVVAKE